jgi:hypothetical protein
MGAAQSLEPVGAGGSAAHTLAQVDAASLDGSGEEGREDCSNAVYAACSGRLVLSGGEYDGAWVSVSVEGIGLRAEALKPLGVRMPRMSEGLCQGRIGSFEVRPESAISLGS